MYLRCQYGGIKRKMDQKKYDKKGWLRVSAVLEHAMVVHVRFQGVKDNFANMNRDKGNITMVEF